MGILVVPSVIALVVLVVVARALVIVPPNTAYVTEKLGRVARALVIVPPNTAYVTEKLGRVARALQPGLHVVTPFVERVAFRVPLGDQSLDVPSVSNTLRGGGEASASGTVTIRVLDPMRAVTEVADYRTALVTLVATSWQRAIGAGESINADQRVRATDAAIQEVAAGWGLALIEMQPSIRPSADAEHVLMAKAEEEREKRILAWLTERGQRPGSDGRPTDAQWEAYQAWIDHELEAHGEAVASAQRLSEEREN
jgi:regulator of protease activity HflC (stomatin/prohibitin superfamily)